MLMPAHSNSGIVSHHGCGLGAHCDDNGHVAYAILVTSVWTLSAIGDYCSIVPQYYDYNEDSDDAYICNDDDEEHNATP